MMTLPKFLASYGPRMMCFALVGALMIPTAVAAETLKQAESGLAALPDAVLSAEFQEGMRKENCVYDSKDQDARDRIKNDVTKRVFDRADISLRHRDDLERDLGKRMDAVIVAGIDSGQYIADDETKILRMAGC